LAALNKNRAGKILEAEETSPEELTWTENWSCGPAAVARLCEFRPQLSGRLGRALHVHTNVHILCA